MNKHKLEIAPLNKDNFHFKQSVYPHLPAVPFRSILLAPSGSGKTVLLSNLVVNIYNSCFERIYVFSPSIGIDNTLQAIVDYQNKFDTNGDKLYFDEYNEAELEKVIETQKKVIEFQKSAKQPKLHSILIIIDDFADDAKFSRQSKLLHALFTRGRHVGISTIVSTQKYNALHPIIRINATSLIIFKLRNQQELDTFLTENSALIDRKILLEIYKKATEQKYNFLYVNLMAKDINDMFYFNFTKKFKF